MKNLRVSPLLPFWLIVPFAFGQNSVYDEPSRSEQARVTILALSTAVHQGFAGGQDVYLAEISTKGGEPRLAKLVDEYSSAKRPILHSLLADRLTFRMKLTRSSACDVPAKTFYLRSENDIFDAGTRSVLSERGNELIRCYNLDHDATRLVK